jgi:hypothetical protein
MPMRTIKSYILKQGESYQKASDKKRIIVLCCRFSGLEDNWWKEKGSDGDGDVGSGDGDGDGDENKSRSKRVYWE